MMNELLIASICASIPVNSTMCLKTLEAAGVQSGIYYTVKTVEEKAKSVAEKETKDILGNKTYDVLAYGATVIKIGNDSAGSMKMGGGPLCDKITFTGSKKQGSVELGWNF